MTAPVASPLANTVDVETPELVVVSYTAAGVGSRAVAALIDALICIVSLLLFVWLLSRLPSATLPSARRDGSMGAGVVMALVFLVQFIVVWLYNVLFEALMDGQTPGKRLMRLRVVRDGGLSIDFGASAIRNIVRIVDMQPGLLYGVGLLSSIVNDRGKRLGDLAAGTLVVKEALFGEPFVTARAERPARAGDAPAPALSTRLTEAEYGVLDQFMRRRPGLRPEAREAIAAGLARKLQAHLEQRPDQLPVAQLVRLHEAEQLARSRGVAARADTGAARQRYAIVAAGAGRWAAFSTRLRDAQKRGLAALDEEQVREFAADYRDLSADLARLRTATRGAAAEDVFYLNRLVANAHSLLYRRRTISLRDFYEFFFVAAPAEVRRSWRPIGLAALLLFAPLAVAGVAVVRQPVVAESLLPPSMIDRAENGIERARRNAGYIEAPEMLRPGLASQIVTNNVRVAFLAFATGITAGIFTVIVLVSNGVSIGAVAGLYQSKGIGALLLSFVAPHGVLELSAIAIAGGAGFLLASGMLLPGHLSRRSAMVAQSRRAIRLVGATVLLLIVAGAIEGFISPIPDWPLQRKLLVSAVTAVLFLVYLLPVGRRATTRPSA